MWIHGAVSLQQTRDEEKGNAYGLQPEEGKAKATEETLTAIASSSGRMPSPREPTVSPKLPCSSRVHLNQRVRLWRAGLQQPTMIPAMPSARVVITGLGCVSAFGAGHAALWDGLMAGTSAIRRITPSTGPLRVSRAASGRDRRVGRQAVCSQSYRKAVKVMARDTEIAVAAAKLAVEDAGLIARELGRRKRSQLHVSPGADGLQHRRG